MIRTWSPFTASHAFSSSSPASDYHLVSSARPMLVRTILLCAWTPAGRLSSVAHARTAHCQQELFILVASPLGTPAGAGDCVSRAAASLCPRRPRPCLSLFFAE